MKIVLQRSLNASVRVDDAIIGNIEHGYVIFVGVAHDDTDDDLNYIIKKVSQLRLFNDENNKLNLNLQQVNGQILSISQFTLLANTAKGNRPSFTAAAQPEKAKALYEQFNKALRQLHFDVQEGIFGADMKVSLVNDGPVTIVIDSKQK